MKNYFTLLVFFLLVVSTQRAFSQTPQWHYLGDTIISENGYHATFAMDGVTPYIAYIEYANDHYFLSLKRFDGANWVLLDTVGLGQNIDKYQVSISSNGIPLLAYFDNEKLRFVLKQFEGSTWVTVSESPQVAEPLYDLSIAFDNEKLYVAFRDPFFVNQVTVWQHNALGWSVVGQPSITSGGVYSHILKVSDGYPWLAYLEGDTSIACIVKKFDGAAWQTIGGQAFTTTFENFFVGATIDFAVVNSTPYIVYYDWSTGWRLSVLMFDEIEWVTVGQPMFTEPTYSVMTIAIDANSQKPYVLFDDSPQDTVGGGLSVMLFDGTSWNYVGQPYFAPQSWEKTLAIHEGIPFVAYQNSDVGFGISVQVFSPFTHTIEPDSANISFKISPNPLANDVLQMKIQSTRASDVRAQIFNMEGRMLQSESWHINAGASDQQINVGALAKGVYVIQLKSKDGWELYSNQFVIVR